MAIEPQTGLSVVYQRTSMFLLKNLQRLWIDVNEANITPNVTELEDGSAIVGEIQEETLEINIPFDGNIAEAMDDSVLTGIASELVSDIDDDTASRKDWEESYKKGLELLGMNYEERAQPFEGASGVIHPLLAEAVTQFQAQAYREMRS